MTDNTKTLLSIPLILSINTLNFFAGDHAIYNQQYSMVQNVGLNVAYIIGLSLAAIFFGIVFEFIRSSINYLATGIKTFSWKVVMIFAIITSSLALMMNFINH